MDNNKGKQKATAASNRMDKIASLAKRRGFVFPDSEIYGGLANTWDYGPLGAELKNNIKNLWWEMFVHGRDDIFGVDASIIMNPKVWDASGHIKGFKDFLTECRHCHERFKVDDLLGGGGWGKEYEFLETLSQGDQEKRVKDLFKKCPNCGAVGQFTIPRKFNLMFKTFFGPAYDEKSVVYLRPETAQAIFVNFKNILATTRAKLPFGVAQIGKAFRNEITPGNFIFRTREFEQMEIEYFIDEAGWEKYFEHWRKEMLRWIKVLGIDSKHIHEKEVPEAERAHYSKRTIDFEYDFPFGRKELYGLAYRTDFDLKSQEEHSGENLKYKDQETGREFWPHVIEPSLGVERTVLAVLLEAYVEEGERTILKFPPRLAPYKAAVFPLLANKPELVRLARRVYDDLRKKFYVAWDDRGNIGKRYYSQDEIGTPYCITIDFESLEKESVTVRDRDTAKQEKIKISKLEEYLNKKLAET